MNSDALGHVVTMLILLKKNLFSSLHVNHEFVKCEVWLESLHKEPSTYSMRTRYQINPKITVALSKAL